MLIMYISEWLTYKQVESSTGTRPREWLVCPTLLERPSHDEWQIGSHIYILSRLHGIPQRIITDAHRLIQNVWFNYVGTSTNIIKQITLPLSRSTIQRSHRTEKFNIRETEQKNKKVKETCIAEESYDCKELTFIDLHFTPALQKFNPSL